MKLGGYRADGTMRVLIPGGMTVLLRGDDASPPIDDKDAEAYGPWRDPEVALTWQERQNLGKQLDRARTVPLQSFALKFPFPAKKKAAPAEEPAPEPAPAETEVAAPAPDAPVANAPLSKGDVLARINEMIAAKDKEKAAAADAEKAKSGPRSTLKRLKLEYESEDREDEKKPVSEVAQTTDEKPATMNFGGAGSGNFGHSGRPGEIGGSGDGGGEERPGSFGPAAKARASEAVTKAEAEAGRPQHDIDRDSARHAAEDRRAEMARSKSEREEGWTVNSPEAKSNASFAHEGRSAEPGGSKYWSKMPDAHQNAFADRVLAATKGGADISAVTTATPTTTGVRFKTIDGHAANVINRVADRAGHRNTQRYDNKTGHYIVHVSTATKK